MNLSENRARDVQQQEQIGRRTSIIAERRETRAPALESAASLRTARRGDVGGADALLRTLGLVERAGGDVVSYMQNKNALDEKDNIDRGFADEAIGAVDEEMMNKSLGYRNAVTKGRTVTNFSKASREFDEELKQMIEDQDSPILEERLAEIDARIEGFFTNFAQDPETGELRDYLQSPGAMRYLAETIQTTRPKAQSAAREMVETKFKAEAFSHFNANVTEQVLETGTLDLNAARGLLPDIVTDQEFSEQAILSVNNAVQALRDRGTPQDLQMAAGLLAGLKQRSRAPINPGVGTSSATGAPAAGNINATGSAGQLAAAFKGTGWSDAVIAGFLGNGEHESGFDSSRVGDSGTAFGHFQWRADRVANFQRVVGTHPRNATPEQSVQFVKWEMDNYRAAGMTKKQRDAILNAQTPEDAARAIDHFYERSDRKSTRDRMAAARRYFGTPADPAPAAADAATPAPGIKLTDPFADPVTLLERSGEFVDIVGIEDVLFSPEQTARIDQLYDATTTELRTEYRKAKAEQQSVNAARLSLGIAGIGGARTTSDDILRAFENDEIGAEEAIGLSQLLERQADRRAAEAEREESRRERAERKAVEDQIEAQTETILGRLTLGTSTAPEARSEAIKLLSDPRISVQVRAGVLSNVMSVTNSYESALANSEVVRNQQADFTNKNSDPYSALKLLAPRATDARISAVRGEYQDLVGRASARMVAELEKTGDPEVAAARARTWLKQQEALLVSRLNVAGGGGSSPNSGR